MSRLKASQVEEYLEKLRSWFDEQLGLDRKSLRKGKMTEDDLNFIRNKTKVKERLRRGLLEMMGRRIEKSLGTYDVDNHILLNPLAFDRLYKEMKVDAGIGDGQTWLPRRETWHSGWKEKLTGLIRHKDVVMEVIRYPKGHRFAGRVIKAYKVKAG